MPKSISEIPTITESIRKLSLKEKSELKSILDGILLEERKGMVYSNYPETMAAMIQTSNTSSSDIALITGRIEEN